jgi:chitinase
MVYGIPAEKINLGVPFYAHTFSNCTELHAPHAGSDTVHFSKDGAFYYDIVTTMDKFTRRWDDRAKAPYLVSTNWNMLVSYDDEESIHYKAQYVVDNNVRGLIIWEITGDYLPDHRTPLLDVIHATFYGTNTRQQ